jgi:hypothetical protein
MKHPSVLLCLLDAAENLAGWIDRIKEIDNLEEPQNST